MQRKLHKAFDVVLNYLPVSFGDFAGLSCDFRWLHVGYGDSNHAFRLQIQDFHDDGQFTLYFDVNCDVFDETTRQWLIEHFLKLLDACLADPDQSIATVNLLSDNEREHLFARFNNTSRSYPSDRTIAQLIEKQVVQTPDRLAIIDGAQQLTYAQLNGYANQLARYLQTRGVARNTLVGLCTDRSADTIVGILAILKAGAAYVPLDPAYPSDRLAFMLNEIDGPILLTQESLHSQVATFIRPQPNGSNNGHQPFIFCLDGDWTSVKQFDDSNLDPVVTPDDLAYVIFTSGSTGKPKGAMIRHQGLTNYIWWARDQYCRDKNEDIEALSFPLFSSLSFDLTVTSIFTPLVSGGTIVVYGDAESECTGEPAVLRVFRENLVDIIKLTPAHLSLLHEMGSANQSAIPTRLRKMIVGGEDFKTHLAQSIHNLFDGAIELYNEYGPTETVVGCMIHQYHPAYDSLSSVPIGLPAANTQIYLLDRFGQPVPSGVIGEIYIGGHGVARGYLNRPELTAERFVERSELHYTPAVDELAPSRLYRTGDLARWLPADDNVPPLEFLGRADHQVKVRGYRIELGEIEASLLAHPAIDECVVTVLAGQIAEQATPSDDEVFYCIRCGLPSNYPDATFEEGVCHMCRAYDTYDDQVARYFKCMDDLRVLAAEIKEFRLQEDRTSKYDCMVLLSGGKDSTYMLYQVVELGLHPLVFTLDNGFISEGAKANCRRVAEHLGLDLVFGTTPHMNAIFVDSLQRFSNVCNGCFKTIYTLSMNLAREHGIRHIFTGLARGQLFETRLSDMYDHNIFDVDEIDEFILQARKAYHRIDDAVSLCLDVDIFNDDTIFDEIQFVDFYRYTDVELDEMLTYLADHAPWIRPADTGRSTNCLINDVGIYVHKKEQGYHNYALPYSWDVRLGHKQRDAALDELDDDIDEENVQRILKEIGYQEKAPEQVRTEQRLVAYYVGAETLTNLALRDFLAQSLPDYMIPAYFVGLEQMPLTQNGKVDRDALPDPRESRAQTSVDFVSARTNSETILTEIWQDVFRLNDVSIYDNFFDLGGDSIISIQIIARASQAGLYLLPRQLFDHQTIADLASVAKLDDKETTRVEQGLISGSAPLTPIQKHFWGGSKLGLHF
ncbi:amino acid adenylation domain-containing protein [Chloroflexi bacterium TSY]|nr:amino acid adenylation domain-containing protein [Chloroflexi bacterium TSY]